MLSEEEAYTKFMAIGLAATVKKNFRNNLFLYSYSTNDQ